MSARVETPANCSGPLRECLQRHPSLTEEKWHRGQMRGWAGYWRRRHEIAALVGQPVEQIASTNLELAKIYRHHSMSGGSR